MSRQFARNMRVRQERDGGVDHARRAVTFDAWMRPHARGYRRILVIAVVLSVVAFLFSGALMFTSGYMISLAATVPFTVLALHLPSIFVRIFGIGKPLIQYVERLASHDWVLRMTSTLRKRVYDLLERRGKTTETFGHSLGVFANDIEHVQNLYLRCIIPMASLLVLYAIIVVAMGLFSPAMGLLLLVTMGVVCVVLPLLSLGINGRRVERLQAHEQEAYELVTERVMNVADWRLSGRRADFARPLLENAAQREREQARIARSQRALALVREFVCAVSICFVFLWAASVFGGSGVAGGGAASSWFATGLATALGDVTMHDSVAYAANWIAAFVLCAFPLFEAFVPANEAVLGIARHKGALADLRSLDGDEKGSVAGSVPCGASCGDASFAQSQEKQCHVKQGQAKQRRRPRDARHALEVAHASFAYPGTRSVLNDLSLAVDRGERVAIIGRSGVGKTTLLELMHGDLVTDEGVVAVAGKVGIIEQDPYVFHMSLRDNLLVANPQATDEEIKQALCRVRLKGLMERLSGGLDAVLAEDGLDVSGGERHRLALARMLLFGCDVVLLDEPFQGLDERTMDEVADVMFEALAEKTVVVVTHDLGCIDRFDRVLELSKEGIIDVTNSEER